MLTVTAEEIVAEALKLEPKSREELAKKLLRSLDEGEQELSEEECEKAWLKVSERRLQELREGKVKAIPGEEVMKELQDLLA